MDLVYKNTSSGGEGHFSVFDGGAAVELLLSASGVPVHDIAVEFPFELVERIEPASRVELVLEMAEHLFGGRVVQTVALAAHRLADAECFQPLPPPAVLVLPAHVRMQDRVRVMRNLGLQHGQEALLLGEIGMPGDVPGDDLLASHVVDGCEVGLRGGDLELGDVRSEFLEWRAGGEVPFQQVTHVPTGITPV